MRDIGKTIGNDNLVKNKEQILLLSSDQLICLFALRCHVF